ncbi:MAG TPA: MOSC domain-containing protein [Solirubrobacteraceae bacterium]|nr:MOSC domain-containing protein [Solirubrobacteraceae bacterium]
MVVSELSIAVVKGTRLVHPGALRIGPGGAEDDRRFHVVAAGGRQEGAPRRALTLVRAGWDADARRLTLRFPDGGAVDGTAELGGPAVARVTWDCGRPVDGREVLGPWSQARSAYLGEPVVLAEAAAPRRAIDVAPVTLVSAASVERLEVALGASGIGARRFRMTMLLDGLQAHEEDRWYGRALTAGGCRLRVTGPVPRCAVVTRDPDTARRDHAALRAIVGYRPPVELADGSVVKAPFGVYAEVEEPGTVRAGDRVVVDG